MRQATVRAASLMARRCAGRTLVSPMIRLESVRAMTSAGAALAQLAKDFPHMDAVRYEHKNVKWDFTHVHFYAEAMATGILETGLRPGDIVLSWLPQHFAEQHILQFACAKAGLILYSLDPAQAITDPEGAKASLARALEVTEANVLVTQEAGNDVNYVRLCEGVIPEIRIFDMADGEAFFTPRYPHLRLPVQTGFDCQEKDGYYLYKQLMSPSGQLPTILGGTVLSGSTPLMGELVTGPDGLPAKGKVLTNDEVVATNAWPVFTSILKREYLEVEGVGVIF